MRKELTAVVGQNSQTKVTSALWVFGQYVPFNMQHKPYFRIVKHPTSPTILCKQRNRVDSADLENVNYLPKQGLRSPDPAGNHGIGLGNICGCSREIKMCHRMFCSYRYVARFVNNFIERYSKYFNWKFDTPRCMENYLFGEFL